MSASSPTGKTPPKRSRQDAGPTPTATNGTSSPPSPSPSSSSSRTCLLVVDVQNDFCTGSLKAEGAELIIPVINRLRHQFDWDLIVFTGDAHPPNHVSFYENHKDNPLAKQFQPLLLPNGEEQVMWPVHCVKGSWGYQLHDQLERDLTKDVWLEKGTVPDQEYYSAFTSSNGKYHTELASMLRERGITHVVACGLVYEFCVGNSAVDSAREGFNTYMVWDATKGLTDEAVNKMAEKLRSEGVTICHSDNLPELGFRRKEGEDTEAEPMQISHNANPTPSTLPYSLPAPSSVDPSTSRPRILLGLSGSVAAIKAPELLRALSQWAEVRVVATKPAQSFFSEQEMGVRVYQNEDEWEKRWQRGDAVLHIELRRWADMMVIAPLSANTLAKISNGLCDNLLSTVVRCWSFSSHPLLLAPAMNTLMWDSPFTSKQLGALQELGATTIPPVAKKLACGDEGMGAMASVEEIEQAAQQAWKGMVAAGYQQQPVPASLAQ